MLPETPDPFLALSIAGVLVAVAGVLFWPGRGFFWRWRRGLRATGRVLVEDALKHLWDCEYQGYPGTLNSLAGALGMSRDRTTELLSRLEDLELVAGAKVGYRLTGEGRSEALRVIRVHRLWERFLAEETGVEAKEWHAQAEIREHLLSPDEADALAARLGHPRFDPHGDPIPTGDGDLPPQQGLPLSELAIGQEAEIVHLEDEPETIFAQLVADGLYPGLRVRVLESGRQRIVLEAAAEEKVLAPILAANVTVVVLPETDTVVVETHESLAVLEPGDHALIHSLSPACRGVERRRLLDLGLVPGTEVSVEMRSPSGDPMAYRIRGALIALRRDQAGRILIRREKVAA